jgi:hypothetical protein
MERTSLCVACTYYGVELLSLSVDPACRSKDEADRLCILHRARMFAHSQMTRSEEWGLPASRSTGRDEPTAAGPQARRAAAPAGQGLASGAEGGTRWAEIDVRTRKVRGRQGINNAVL